MDLGELWRARKWRKLLNLIDRLPRWSLFQEAKANDPEIARQLVGVELPEYQHRFSEWTPEREAIASLYDLMAILVSDRRTEKVESFPRPVSEIERSAAQQIERSRELFVQRLRALQEEA